MSPSASPAVVRPEAMTASAMCAKNHALTRNAATPIDAAWRRL
jgi:hypothetical protein